MMRLNNNPPSNASAFITFAMSWREEDRELWTDVWSQDERNNYHESFAYDLKHGFETPTPILFEQIRMVD